MKSRANASGDDTDSSRTRSSILTQKNAPPCIKRKEKKEGDRRLSGFLHTCDSHWFPSWTKARLWLEQNEDHLSFSTSMGISGKEDKTNSGKKAIKQKEVLAASSKKVEDQTKKKPKQSASGVGPLAALQAAMEDEIRSSGTKSPDMFDSEEENGKASEGDKTKIDGKEKSKGKATQPKKQKKTPESCKTQSKENEESESEDSGEEMGNSKSRMIGRQLEKEIEKSSLTGGTGGKEKAGDKQGNSKGVKVAEVVKVGMANDTNVKPKAQSNKSDVASTAGNDAKEMAGEKTSPNAGNLSKVVIKKKEKEEQSSSSDSDSDTEGFSGAEEANISTGVKKVDNGDIKKRKTEQTSSSGSESESESEEEKSSKVTDPKSSSQASKTPTINKGPMAVSPSKGGEKATEKKDEDSSSSESESETEARSTTKTTKPKSAPVASKKPPQGFSAPRLESFKKAGLPSPGSTATTSAPKGPSSNTSVYNSPKTVESAQVEESGSGSSGSSDDESSEEETKKRKVAGIKKV